MKVTLEDKYNHCIALNIELEETIEMQNLEMQKKDKIIKRLEEENVLLRSFEPIGE